MHSLSSLQNGRFIFLQFMLQNEITCSSWIGICILLNFISKRLPKNETHLMVLLLLPISLSLFWLRPCNKNFYKDFESLHVNFEVTEHKDFNIPERYSFISKDNLRSPNGKGQSNLLDLAPRFCRQSEKI